MTKNQVVLKTQAAAEMLGVHTETIRRLARKGELPSFKVGKDWRFRRDVLMEWMEKSNQNSPSVCILVIDDNRSVRKLIRRHLENAGYRVVTAADGREGLESVHSNDIQLVLLDLKMPGMMGPEIVAEIKKTHPYLPIIIVTGYPDSQLMLEVNVFCPVMLIAKPIDKSFLLEAVSTTLKGTLSIKEGTAL